MMTTKEIVTNLFLANNSKAIDIISDVVDDLVETAKFELHELSEITDLEIIDSIESLTIYVDDKTILENAGFDKSHLIEFVREILAII